MKLRKPQSPTIDRLLRTALALGLVGGLAGVLLLGGQAAHGTMGTEPGAVKLSAATGSTSSTPTWSTTQGCPTGFQGSAVFEEVWSNGSSFTTISPVVNSNREVLTGSFNGTLQTSIAMIKSIGGIANGGTQELFVQCASGVGATGNVQDDMDIWITYSSDGSTYTTTSSASATATTTSSTSPTTCPSATPTCSAASASGGGSAAAGSTVSPSASSTPTGPAPTPSSAQSNLPVTG